MFEGEEKRRKLPGMIDVKMAYVKMRHALPRHPVARERVDGSGAAIHHQPDIRRLDKVARGVTRAIRYDRA
jgi:hypothetical protein